MEPEGLTVRFATTEAMDVLPNEAKLGRSEPTYLFTMFPTALTIRPRAQNSSQARRILLYTLNNRKYRIKLKTIE